MTDFEIKSKDTYPYISGFVTDAAGLVDLADAATVKLNLRDTPGAGLLVQGVCDTMTISAGVEDGLIPNTNTSKTPPAAWTVDELAVEAAWRYVWVSPDTDVAGDYEGEIEVTWAAGKVQTFPNERARNFTVKFGDDLD